MDSFLSNIFPWMGQQQKQARAAAQIATSLDVETSFDTHHHTAASSPIIPLSMDVDTIVEMDTVSSDYIQHSKLSSPEMTQCSSRKRNRRMSTPTLICSSVNTTTKQSITPSAVVTVVTPCHSDIDDDSTHVRPKKMFRGTTHHKIYRITTTDEHDSGIVAEEKRTRTIRPSVATLKEDAKRTKTLSESPFDLLPEDIVAHTLSFVNDVSDRFSVQCTSKQFRRISNAPSMMKTINVGGDPVTGKNGIILETDNKETATHRLSPFVTSGNLEAIYMLGIIKSYCNCDVESGISLLKIASAQGFVRASYALGLVLRDTSPDDAFHYMTLAADQKYLPALQELLPARDMKLKYGEPNADELRRHLDHLCLNRLLSRNYILSSNLRSVNTSHCWNHLCGRWAYKASTISNILSPNYNQVSNTSAAATAGDDGVSLHHRRVSSNMSNESSSTSLSSSSTNDTSNCNASDTQQQKNRVSRMKMCSRCCRAKYCSKLCQVYDWRSGRHKMECHFL